MLKIFQNNNKLASDKRSQYRVRPNFHLKVFNRQTGIGIGPLGNISSGGIMVYSHEPFLPGNVIEFAMVLPAKISGKSSIGFKGKCVWCRECDGSEYHETGFELIHPDEESVRILEVLMHAFT